VSSVIFARAAEQWQEMKSEWLDHLDYAYLAAEEGTGGVLVNKEGRALHMDGWDLFTGNARRAELYASEELLEWWSTHPRLSMDQFEKQWIQGKQEFQ
jgi:hypothetical protein